MYHFVCQSGACSLNTTCYKWIKFALEEQYCGRFASHKAHRDLHVYRTAYVIVKWVSCGENAPWFLRSYSKDSLFNFDMSVWVR